MSEDRMIIQTAGLKFSYGKDARTIQNLNLNVKSGSVYGFLGPNGAGKTTTIRLLLGLLKPESGNIQLFGKSLNSEKNLILEKTGALVENPSFYFHLTAKENLEIFRAYRGLKKERIDKVLATVGLSQTGTKKVKEFSTGMKQRLGVALALLPDPDLIILDEPTNGLDPKGMLEMREMIKKLSHGEGKTIFLSSHLLDEVEKICTHVGIIQNGEMKFEGKTEELKASQSGDLLVEIETGDSVRTEALLTEIKIKIAGRENGFVKIYLPSKSEIPEVIDCLRGNGINVFQVTINSRLENIFLSVTEN